MRVTFTHINEINSGNVLPYTLNAESNMALFLSSFSQVRVKHKYFWEKKSSESKNRILFAYLISLKSKYHLHKESLPHISCFEIHSIRNQTFSSGSHCTFHVIAKQKEMFAVAF